MSEQPEQPARTANGSTVREDARLVEALQSENSYLRQQLDHQTRIIAGLAQRLPDLPAGAVSNPETPQGRDPAPLRYDQPAKAF